MNDVASELTAPVKKIRKVTPADKPKKTRKKKELSFIAISKEGLAKLVPQEEVAKMAWTEGSKLYSLGKAVKSILVFPGKHDLITGQKGPEKVIIKFEK